jgi:alkanesulfonate monooxygenase SsuD/methylene tetrahydromethanopterin reductase-like flavin-dependent oxidoreductase (luciferase family)
LVSPVTFRNPALLAKTVTTLDVISGGRAVLGLGAGWIAAEHAAYGLPFPPVAERQDRLEEAAQICRAMLTRAAPGETVTFTGRYYQVSQAPCEPPPAQARVPILIGGSGEQRALRAVARYADACNIRGDAPGLRHKLAVLARHCHDAGRDPAEITTSTALAPPPTLTELTAAARERFDAGIDAIILLADYSTDPRTVASWGRTLTAAGS